MTVVKMLNGDWVKDPITGATAYLTGLAALAQVIGHRVGMFLGEWSLDPTQGVDWLNLLGGPKIDQDGRILNAIRNAILADSRVTGIQSLNLSQKGNKLTVNLIANTTIGLLSTVIPIG